MIDMIFDFSSLPNIGQKVGQLLKINLPLLLYGEMGTGKTTLTKEIIRSLGCEDEVTSPTFNIMQSYTINNKILWHVDLYRLDTHDNFEELGLDELNMQSLLIIEWPERLGERLFVPHLKGKLKVLADHRRHLIIEKIL